MECSIIREGLQVFRVRSVPVPAVPSPIIEPVWREFAAPLASCDVASPRLPHRSSGREVSIAVATLVLSERGTGTRYTSTIALSAPRR